MRPFDNEIIVEIRVRRYSLYFTGLLFVVGFGLVKLGCLVMGALVSARASEGDKVAR